MKLAYYPGCSGQGTSAEYERSTRAVCRALEIGLKEISDWSCCGSTPAHACDHVLSSALSARNLALAAAEGAERVGTPCPSCLANLKTAKYRMQDEAFRDKVNALLDNPCPEELPETVSILQVLVEDYGTGAIAGMVKDGVPVNIQCVGAGAVNQAIKAVAIARGFLIPTGFDISCAPVFSDILINGESRTAIRLSIYVHQINRAAMDNVVMDDVKPVA